MLYWELDTYQAEATLHRNLQKEKQLHVLVIADLLGMEEVTGSPCFLNPLRQLIIEKFWVEKRMKIHPCYPGATSVKIF